jgi:hypothetical protein
LSGLVGCLMSICGVLGVAIIEGSGGGLCFQALGLTGPDLIEYWVDHRSMFMACIGFDGMHIYISWVGVSDFAFLPFLYIW